MVYACSIASKPPLCKGLTLHTSRYGIRFQRWYANEQ
jgi:hypothetical protein